MPHQLLGYEIDDVKGVLMSLSIMNAVSEKQQSEAKNPTNNSKQQARRNRMNKKKPGYV
jgi:hypothetical protein